MGVKALYELYPGGLKLRAKEERRRKWAEKQRGAVARAVAELAKVRGVLERRGEREGW